MLPSEHELRDGRQLLIREATAEDARVALEYVHAICGESDNLTFGPGEFAMTESEEVEFLKKAREAENQLYLLGLIDGGIAGMLSFSGGHRPRIRHTGELGMSVRREFWGMGIGSLMLVVLIAWARESEVVTKINLRVRTDNERAVRLYEKHGFVREGTISREIRLDGKYFDQYWMGLEL